MIENLIQPTGQNLKSGLNTHTHSSPLIKEEGRLEGQFKTLFNSFNKQLKFTGGEQSESGSKECNVNDEPVESIDIKSNGTDGDKSLEQVINREKNTENSEQADLNDAAAENKKLVTEPSGSDLESGQANESNSEGKTVELKEDSGSAIMVEITIDKPDIDIKVNKSEAEIPLNLPDIDFSLHKSESDSGPYVEKGISAEKKLMGEGEIKKQETVDEVLKFTHAAGSDETNEGGLVAPNSGTVVDQQNHYVDSDEPTSGKVAGQQINIVDPKLNKPTEKAEDSVKPAQIVTDISESRSESFATIQTESAEKIDQMNPEPEMNSDKIVETSQLKSNENDEKQSGQKDSGINREFSATQPSNGIVNSSTGQPINEIIQDQLNVESEKGKVDTVSSATVEMESERKEAAFIRRDGNILNLNMESAPTHRLDHSQTRPSQFIHRTELNNGATNQLNDELPDGDVMAKIVDSTISEKIVSKTSEAALFMQDKMNVKRERIDISSLIGEKELQRSSGYSDNGVRAVNGISFNSGQYSFTDSGLDTEPGKEEISWKEHNVDPVDIRDSNRSDQSAFILSRLGDATLSNVYLRRAVLPSLTQTVIQAAGDSKTTESWQRHHFTFEDGSKMQLSARQVDGVLQIKLGASIGELGKLLQVHLDEIREHLEEECELKIDLQFESDGDGREPSGMENFFGTSKAKSGSHGLEEKSVKSGAGQTINNAATRKFGYNNMEWTA